MNVNIPPTPTHLYARTTKYAYIYRRETEGSYAFRGTPSLFPLYMCIYIYMHIGLSDCHFSGKMLIKDNVFFFCTEILDTPTESIDNR